MGPTVGTAPRQGTHLERAASKHPGEDLVVSDRTQGREEDQCDWRIGKALDFVVACTLDTVQDCPRPSESALSFWIFFGILEFSPGPALLPCCPPSSGAWGSFSCQPGRCISLPPQLDFRGLWDWSLYPLFPGQLRSLEEPHHSRGSLSLWTGKEYTQTCHCFVSPGL